MTDNHAIHIEIIPHTIPWPPQANELFGRDAIRFIPTIPTTHDQSTNLSTEPPLPHLIGFFENNTLIAGLLYLQFNDHAAIHHLIIPPQHRGKGIAGSLLRRAISFAESHNATYLLTTAGFGCHDHINLYTRLGFQSTSDHAPYIMIKTL
ncbi:Acetyltransferase (GNAT) family protein [Poriferisphaera corsica]|uniref:Acetyltransferase (GNAT) family protein n=1 Tax=Poriferisphaera corsica TaxID=2528020 RepID=A0A517YW12_9BACT|nr:GNAT family N-acetyltransferase [Poriferisphaera corsica]QDU34423.1 Acetyltransferase (GNAT) family protein [Poriferisphaera corsica]